MRLLFLLLLAPLLAFAQEKPTIILDPGHGGKDQGAHIRSIEEKKLTLRTSFLVKKHLEELGYRVVMTRARDVFLPLEKRVGIANGKSPSIFVSIHYNSAASPAAKGIEIYYYGAGQVERKNSSKDLASLILKQMVRETGASSRGVKNGNFQVIRDTSMPAVLIEAGFLTNNEERRLLGTHAYLEQLSKGVATGIDHFIRKSRKSRSVMAGISGNVSEQ